MRKATLLFLALLLLAAPGLYAQNSSLQVGAGAGLAISNFTGDDAGDTDTRNAPFFGGVLVWHPAGAMLGFETGAFYVSKGASGEEEGVEVEFKIGYVEVPLLLRLGFPMASGITPVVNLGGAVAFKASCKFGGADEGVSVEVDCEEAGYDVKSVDFGGMAGVAVDIPISARAVLAPFARYTLGLANVPDADEGDDVDLKNTSFQFGAMIRVRL